MKKKHLLNLAIALTTITSITGCGGGPTPSSPDKKPTVYVKSNTLEKFKDVTKETAVWNGISPFFIKDKQYMRCDMTDESVAVFAREGFEVVASPENADYTFDVTLLSCSVYASYNDNRSELPIKEKALYKDFTKWIEEADASEVPKDAKEIAKLISENNPEGYKRFFDGNYMPKYGQDFDYSENWGNAFRSEYSYLKKTEGVVLPSKYYGMAEEDEAELEKLNKKFEDKGLVRTNHMSASLGVIGSGANLSSTPGGDTVGGIAIGIGILGALTSASSPRPVNEFTITNNRTGKSWSKVTRFSIGQQAWDDNIDKPLYDWTIDEIPWGDLD